MATGSKKFAAIAGIGGLLLGGLGSRRSKLTKKGKKQEHDALKDFENKRNRARKLGATTDDFADSQNQKAAVRLNNFLKGSSV